MGPAGAPPRRRLGQLSAQLQAAHATAAHVEGATPLTRSEDSGELLPDGRRRRKLPDLAPGSLDVVVAEARYAAEREKRLAFTARFGTGAGRSLQYPRVADLAETDPRFARMLADPYVADARRAPRTDEVEYAILGGGYGGLLAGARLREAGFDASDIMVIDKGGDVGGTWYWNRYPGAMCDVESYVYMPLCEELGYVPTEKYAHQPELLAHSRAIMAHYGLYARACLGTEVKELRWEEAAALWLIRTDRGDVIRARHAVVNFGVFSHPKLPAVPGVADFEGAMFHTSRWDYAATGGSAAGVAIGCRVI
jgi:cyclohexanone monooxygenase